MNQMDYKFYKLYIVLAFPKRLVVVLALELERYFCLACSQSFIFRPSTSSTYRKSIFCLSISQAELGQGMMSSQSGVRISALFYLASLICIQVSIYSLIFSQLGLSYDSLLSIYFNTCNKSYEYFYQTMRKRLLSSSSSILLLILVSVAAERMQSPSKYTSDIKKSISVLLYLIYGDCKDNREILIGLILNAVGSITLIFYSTYIFCGLRTPQITSRY